MNRNRKMFLFVESILMSIFISSSVLQANNSKNEKQFITQEQATKHAAKLANEKCQKDFGMSPFKPDSYKAELVNSKWSWGKISPKGINGYSAKVEFNKDGSDEKVRVAFHTDVIQREPELQKVPIKIETIRPKK